MKKIEDVKKTAENGNNSSKIVEELLENCINEISQDKEDSNIFNKADII
jgi:hypothetical protein